MTNYYQNCKIPDSKLSDPWCKSGGTCFRGMHDIFSSPPFSKQCPINEKIAADLCKKYEFLASKTIRVQSVQKLPQDINFKIILLVRDPRGIASSRVNQGTATGPGKMWTQKMPKHFWKFGEICRVYDLFIKEAAMIDAEKLKNILIVRYEDVLKDRVYWAQKIYDFVGLKMHKRVEHDLLEKISKYNRGAAEEYSLKWLKTLEWRTVEKIENSCVGMFEYFGYKRIGTRERYSTMKGAFRNQNFDEIDVLDEIKNKL